MLMTLLGAKRGLAMCFLEQLNPTLGLDPLCVCSEGTASLGIYSATINTVLYNSTSYFDDLAWGALWLHRLTGQATYLDQVPEPLFGSPRFSS